MAVWRSAFAGRHGHSSPDQPPARGHVWIAALARAYGAIAVFDRIELRPCPRTVGAVGPVPGQTVCAGARGVLVPAWRAAHARSARFFGERYRQCGVARA